MSFERRPGARRAGHPSLPRLRLPGGLLRHPVARGAAVTLATFLTGYFVAASWLFPAGEDPTDATFVDVPDLEGLAEADAGQRLSDLGLTLQVATRIHDDELASGAVLAQSPLPGQVARPGDTVAVTLSRGPASRLVPELEGISAVEAARLLRTLGFEVEIVERREGGPAGVIESRPEAGTRLHVPAKVELVVGEGAPIVDVPDLRGRHVDDIAPILEEGQLQMGAIRYRVDAPEAPGRVVSQSPAAGSVLRAGGFVSIVVAGTPPDSMAADIADEDIPPLPRDTIPRRPGGG